MNTTTCEQCGVAHQGGPSDTECPLCSYWLWLEEAEAAEAADAQFDGGEFSRAFHAGRTNPYTPCGTCAACTAPCVDCGAEHNAPHAAGCPGDL